MTNMTNLKITFHLNTSYPVLLNRFTTIDSIILAAYYGYRAKAGKRLPYDPNHETVDFIHRQDGIFSGSIWYIEREADIYYDFHTIVRKPEYRKLFEATGKKKQSSSQFKAAMIEEEIMLAKSIHFYVRGSRKHIEALLQSEVKSIGKKQKLGFGTVESVEVEEIAEDKGFMISPTTPSKPLPIKTFSVDSKKIALFRPVPPYWEQDGREACYMPTTALYEFQDKTAKGRYKVAKDTAYISNPRFIYEQAKAIEGRSFAEPSITTKPSPRGGGYFEYVSNLPEPKICAMSGEHSTAGMEGDMTTFITRWKGSFGDFDYIRNTSDFIADHTLWCIDNISKIGYALVTKGDKEWRYLQGSKKIEGERINDYIVDHTRFKPPFSINLKDTQNSQHVSFKGMVSVSNAFYYVQYGNRTLQIDVEMLNAAIKDIRRLTEKHKHITKSHLCGLFKDAKHINLKKEAGIEEKVAVMEFHKKYNSDLRYYLSVVSF